MSDNKQSQQIEENANIDREEKILKQIDAYCNIKATPVWRRETKLKIEMN